MIGIILDEEVPGRGRIPLPFSLADLAEVTYRKENTNSLKFFLSKICKPATDNDSSTRSILMIDLKEKYEAFCFVNEYKEMVLSENK